MRKAILYDRKGIVDILCRSFHDNKSVNYLLSQDDAKGERLRHFMGYAFDVCHNYGDVFISDDGNACALILLPEKKKTTLKSIGFDLRFIIRAIGPAKVRQALSREAQIKAKHPKQRLYYLWFIGVKEDERGKGVGSRLLSELIGEAERQNRTLCLETSTDRNLPWYKKFGFDVYDELDLGYRLYFLKRG